MAKKFMDLNLDDFCFKEKSTISINEISSKDIAVIGMAARMPLGENLNDFWINLKKGSDGISKIPSSRRKDLDDYLYYKNISPKDEFYRKIGYIGDIDKFDYGFFRFSPKEASLMDPVHRLFLETSWQAIEDAGYGENKIKGTRTGVYVGLTGELRYKSLVSELEPESMSMSVTGNLAQMIASRLSYLLDLKGPSVLVDTTCSSSLVALHFACQAIRSGECEMAVTGGVCINLLPFANNDTIGIESSDGKTKAFDNSSDGTGEGEGAGAVLLKPLYKALEDGDNIYAVIKGSFINQDGNSIGITAPNPAAQEDVIAKAWNNSGIEPESIGYIETHGTGTRLGDPIEIEGISRAFRRYTDRKQFCAIGSLKSNIGHLNSAAGIASFIKSVLILHNGEIPPTIHFNRPNKEIDFENSPVYIADSLEKWEESEIPRRCAVSSFGLGGTNCHVVLEQAPKKNKENSFMSSIPKILTISAKSMNALVNMARNYLEFLETQRDVNINDFCYTANTGRGHYNYRLVILPFDVEDLKNKIRKVIDKDTKLTSINESDILFGSYKIVSTKKDVLLEGEITEVAKMELDIKANNLMSEYNNSSMSVVEILKEMFSVYVQGGDIAWEEFYSRVKFNKLSIPSYPFERKRCWIDSFNKLTNNLLESDNLYYTTTWVEKSVIKTDFKGSKGIVLVIRNREDMEHGLSEQFVKLLKQREIDVIEIAVGLKTCGDSSQKYFVDGSYKDYLRVLEEVSQKDITQILYLGTLTKTEDFSTSEKFVSNQQTGITYLFNFSKALMSVDNKEQIDMVIFGAYANSVVGQEMIIRPENAAVFGIGKVIENESLKIKVRCIDIDEETPMETIMSEVFSEKEYYTIAYRNNKRYTEEIYGMNIGNIEDEEITIKENGVYIITGGTGGIGLEMAKYLALKNNVNIVLISRSGMPEKNNWDDIVSEGKQEKLIKKINYIRNIEESGSKVFCIGCDVSDELGMNKAIHDIKAKYGQINGVIHSAGIPGDGFIVKKNTQVFEKNLSPKVLGTCILDKVTSDDDLDFFVLFSALTSIISAPGQSDYTAANSFLDSYRDYRQMKGKKTVVINWAGWKETGMAADYEVNKDGIFKVLYTKKAILAFHNVLNKKISRALIGEINYDLEMLSDIDINDFPISISDEIKRRIEGIFDDEMISDNEEQVESEHITLKGRQGSDYTSLEEITGKIWASVLGFSEINIYDDFYEVGGDSIIAMKIVNYMNRELKINCEVSSLLAHPTVKELAEFLDNDFDNRDQKDNIYSSIEPALRKEYYPVSSAQRRMYIISRMEGGQASYNTPGAAILEGEYINRENIENTFIKLITRHETLRTSFKEIEGETVQFIHKDFEFKLEYWEMEEENDKHRIENIVNGFIRPFDLSKAPLIRAGLIKLSDDKSLLIYDMHHIISDGTSTGILIEEFFALLQGQELPPLRIQYKDYSEWQRKMLSGERIKKQEEYWLEKFEGEIPILAMPLDYARPSIQSFEGDSITFGFEKDMTMKLKQLAKETGSTLYMVLLSLYNVLLHKYTGQEDIIVGSPISGRPHADLENIIGMFVNTLAMRNTPKEDMTFMGFLKTVKENSLEAYQNQDYQFEELVEKLELKRDLSRNPLFDTMFILQNIDSGNEEDEYDVKIQPYDYENKVSRFDIVLSAFEAEENIGFELEYCTKLFKSETIELIMIHFINLAKNILDNPHKKLSDIEMITEREKNDILNVFNNTKKQYPKEKNIVELFEEQVLMCADDVAVVLKDSSYTYNQLNQKANVLANVLREKGIIPDSIVGIMTDKSLEMVVGILAILKAGGAYLPIDSDYPEDRIRYMVEDSEIQILLSARDFYGITSKLSLEIINIDEPELFEGGNTKNPQNINTPDNLAYVMYTSGSTGTPKGVLVEHKNVVRLVKDTDFVDLDKTDRILQTGAIVFDATTFEMWGALLNGLRLYLIDENSMLDAKKLKEVLEECEITTLWLTSPLFNQLSSENPHIFKGIKNLLVGGDVLSPKHINKVRSICSDTNIINGYGPTENTTFSTCFKIDRDYEANIPIGKPISNSTAYIVDKNNKLLPIGVPGELLVGGKGVSRGYLNLPELTKDRFVPDPFVEGERLYKTGDMARWLPDGNIEFLGRIDNQVKIRGFRIELGEIESRLKDYERIKDAVVIDRLDTDDLKYLCAYYVSDEEIASAELREYMSEGLPDYMVPSYFVKIDNIPLNKNGKVDRGALDDPQMLLNKELIHETPTNETEEKLVGIWKEVLGVENIGINDNFFELGGHSLRATIVALKIHKEFDVEIPFSEVFEKPTIKELAEYIGGSGENRFVKIEHAPKKEFYSLSSAQKRLLILDQFEDAGVSYNIPIVMTIEGSLDREKFENAIMNLVKRHESLRTSFHFIDGEPLQKIHDEVDFEVLFMEADEKEADKIIEEFIRPFDLKEAPLFRVGLVKISEEKYLLLFDIHHIITDGTSMGIVINEFFSLYKGEQLPHLNLQYKDFSEWQNGLFKDGTIEAQQEYWMGVFQKEIPVLNMPYDYKRPLVQSFEGNTVGIGLNYELTAKIKDIVSQSGSTLFIVLLAAYNVLLSKYSQQDDIVVGTPIAGRPNADLQSVIGMFVNTLPMRNYPKSDKTFSQFLQDVKRNALEAYENQDFQFEELIEKLQIIRDTSRNPIFDTMLVLQNMETGEGSSDDLSFMPYEHEVNISKFDLTLRATEGEGGIWIDFEYCSKLFKKETIERLAKHYENILDQIVLNVDKKLCEFDLVTDDEMAELLSIYNDEKVDYPKDKTIHQIFEQQVKKTPDNIAVAFDDKFLTYRELNEKANQLALVLRKKGVVQGTVVAIMVERSQDMITGMLAIIKAGGTYLPIDPDYPYERMKYMIDDSNTKILLKTSNMKALIAETINIDDPSIYEGDCQNLENINATSDTAYIIYTSGTTGKPKGVMIEHRNVIRLFYNDKFQFDFNDRDVWTMFHSFCFDFSVWEMYGALLFGGKLVVVPKIVAMEPKKYLKLLIKDNVTVLNQTPTAFYGLVKEELNTSENKLALRYVIFGGEELKPSMLNMFSKRYKETKLINMYGITETTVHVTFKEITAGEINSGISNIGKPIPTNTAYVMDSNMRLVPKGIPGELCVGGEGVAKGYINNPTLTKEKFVQNPYNREERLYRSGDLVRILENGDMQYLGRIDRQVKIRGFRIELGEIEQKLVSHEKVTEAVVVDKQDTDGNKLLLAYIVIGDDVTSSELREYLSLRLPKYMVPSHFVKIDGVPLTSNGKVNYKMLPDVNENIDASRNYQPPENETEEKLVAVFEQMLGLEKIGVSDNFFELGGHSLTAVNLIAKVHKDFDVELPLREVFKTPTIRELAQFINRAKRSKYYSIKSAADYGYYKEYWNEDRKVYPTSSAQKRMYILSKAVEENINFNMPGVITIHGEIDKDGFESAFYNLVKRHEAFRTTFDIIDGVPAQFIHNKVDFSVNFKDLSNPTDDLDNEAYIELIDEEVARFISPFDLSKAPLLRVELIKLYHEKYVLLYDMHHIISDGVSMSILMSEFISLYTREQLPDISIQYKDFAVWQNSLFESEEFKKQEEYWLNTFSKALPEADLPVDYERKNYRSYDGSSQSFIVDNGLKEELNHIALENGSTLYMVLLTAYNILLSKYMGVDDVIVGASVAGRPHADLEKVIGMFVNMLALRNYPEDDKTFEEFLIDVKENTLEAFENQDYQFEMLIDKLNIKKDFSRNPLFDTVFTMINMDMPDVEEEDIMFMPYNKMEYNVSRYDLLVQAMETEEGIVFSVNYVTALFKRDTITKLGRHYVEILNQIVSNQNIKLKDINLTIDSVFVADNLLEEEDDFDF